MPKITPTALLIAFIITTAIACESSSKKESRKLESDLQTYFKVNMMDSSAHLDSFRVLRIDTLTQKILLNDQVTSLGSQIDYLLAIYKSNNATLQLGVNQLRLYKILGSSDLMKIEKSDFDKTVEQSKEIKAELDTVMTLSRRLDSASLTADTIKPLGFQAVCFYQLRKKDTSVERDTAYIFLNTNKDIVKRNDLLKIPYVVDFDRCK